MSLRVKLSFILMGADLMMAVACAASHSLMFLFFLGLAAVMNHIGDTLLKMEKENQDA